MLEVEAACGLFKKSSAAVGKFQVHVSTECQLSIRIFCEGCPDSEGSRYPRLLLKIASRCWSYCRSSGNMTMFCDDVVFDGAAGDSASGC